MSVWHGTQDQNKKFRFVLMPSAPQLMILYTAEESGEIFFFRNDCYVKAN